MRRDRDRDRFACAVAVIVKERLGNNEGMAQDLERLLAALPSPIAIPQPITDLVARGTKIIHLPLKYLLLIAYKVFIDSRHHGLYKDKQSLLSMHLRDKRRVFFIGGGSPSNIPVYTATLGITVAKRGCLDAAHQATRGKACFPFRA